MFPRSRGWFSWMLRPWICRLILREFTAFQRTVMLRRTFRCFSVLRWACGGFWFLAYSLCSGFLAGSVSRVCEHDESVHQLWPAGPPVRGHSPGKGPGAGGKARRPAGNLPDPETQRILRLLPWQAGSLPPDQAGSRVCDVVTAQSCPTLRPRGLSPPAPPSAGFSRQAHRVGSLPFSRGSSRPWDQTCASYICTARRLLHHWRHPGSCILVVN